MQRFISFYKTLLAQEVRMLIMGIYVGYITASCRPHTKEEKDVMRQPTEQLLRWWAYTTCIYVGNLPKNWSISASGVRICGGRINSFRGMLSQQ